MYINNFKLMKEDDDSYHIAHPNGKSIVVSKKGLSSKAEEIIQKLRGKQHFDGGGQVSSVDDLPETPNSSQASPEDLAQTSAPSQAVQDPDDASSSNQSLPLQTQQGGFEEEKAANLAQANAIAGQGSAEKQAIQDTLDDVNSLPSQQDIIAANKAKDDALFNAYQNKTIDPDRYWNSKSTGGKIVASLGMILSGFGSGGAHQQNAAQQVIQNAISNDIDAQKNDQSQSFNLWKMNREALDSDLAANLATQNQMYTGLKYKLAQAASQFKGPQALAAAQGANALIDQKLAMNRLKLSLLSPSSDADPAQKVQFLVPPAHQQKVFDEIDAAKATASSGPKILEAFDNASKEVRPLTGGTGTSLTAIIPGMESANQKAMHTLLGPTFKDVEGTVRQAAMDNIFHNTTPQFGDSDNTIATKRAALVSYLKSKEAASTAKGYGIDLSKDPRTSFNASPAINSSQQMKIQQFMKDNPQVKDPQQALQILKSNGRL